MRDARKKGGGRRTPDHSTRGGDNFPAKTGDFKLAVDRKSAFWAATNATTLTRDSFTQKTVARFVIYRSTSGSATRRPSARFSADAADSVTNRPRSCVLRSACSFFSQ